MRQINLNRQLLGLEDILFGTGTVTQTRGGQLATVTKVNAGNIPFDETRTLVQWAQSVNVEALGSSITELQAIYDNLASIHNIGDNLALLNNVMSNITVLWALHTNLSILQNINSNIPIITDVNTNLGILTSIYNNLSSLVNIHTNLTRLLAIDSNMLQLLNINTNLPALLSINTTIVPNIMELLDVNNKAEQVALDKQAVESLASQVTIDKQDVNTMKLAVEAIYDTFDDRFLGAKDTDPLVDNDGNSLLDGALYFNTISNALKVYALDITTWVTIPQIYLSSLLDVQLTSITTNSILTWGGTKWVNTTTPVFDSVKLTGTNYGVMSWNSEEQVPSITLNSDVDIDLGESLILVKNTTGSTILDGKVVMAVGSNGNSGNILVSLHSGLKTDAKRTIGIATQNILNGSTGFVTKEGKVKGINTTGSTYGETWVDGDILYVKANGGLTKVEPLDSQLKMPIAFVVHAHTSGTLYVRTTGIDENHDRDLISTKLDTSEYTATDILTKLKTVDGSGSGLEAETATKLSTARTIALTGDVVGSVSFNGSANVSITTIVADDSHNHIISNVDGLQAALDSKVASQIANITVQVPEDFATINLALKHLTETYNPTHGFTAEVSLVNGYIIAEQILVDGQDLSWIKLTSRSATGTGAYPNGKHLVDRNKLTIDFGLGYGITSYPVFGAKNGASSPVLTFVLDGQVDLGSSTPDDNKMGIVSLGAKVSCNNTAGAIQMSSVACHALSGGTISAYTMTNSSNSSVACHALSGGTISAYTMTNSSNSGVACHALSGGTMSAYTMTNSSTSGVACYALSGTISAETMTNSSTSGVACYALSGTISAETMTNSSSSGFACHALSGGTISAETMTNNSSSSFACHALSGGTISAYTMTNSSSSSFACYARSGTISAYTMTNSSNNSVTCYARSGTISAETMTLSNTESSTSVLAQVLSGGVIRSLSGTWTNNGTGAKANQVAVTITANGYINRIG